MFSIEYRVDQDNLVIWMLLIGENSTLAKTEVKDPDDYVFVGKQVADWFKGGLFPREALESMLTQASNELYRFNYLSTPDTGTTIGIFGPSTPDEPLWTTEAGNGTKWPQ